MNTVPKDEGRVIEVSESFSRKEDRALPAVVEQGQATPMSMLAMAVQKGMDPATLKDLMALQERWEANEARKAYAEALASFKAEAPSVRKDKKNTQYDSMYTTKGNLVNTVNPVLSRFGLSAGWTFDQTKGISVTCKLTHKMGHSESVTLSGMPDDSGKKNPLQQIKSAITYLEIATFEAVTGTASVEGSMDDDGNGSGDQPPTPPARPGPQPYPMESFNKNLPAWTKLIQSGKKTPKQIIAMVSSKAVLSDAQREEIMMIAVPTPDAEFVADMEDAQ